MSFPITPLTVVASLEMASATLSAAQSTLTQGAQTFAQLLASPKHSSDSAAGRSQLRQIAETQLKFLHQRIVERLEAAGVETAFQIEITAEGLEGRLTAGGAHIDNDVIQSVLDASPDLRQAFQDLQSLLRHTEFGQATRGPSVGAPLRLTFNDRNIEFEFEAVS